MAFRPWVTAVEQYRYIEWLGRLGLPGIFDGRHSFTLTPMAGGRTLIQQSETFTGALVPFTGSLLARTRAGFVAMNEALAEQAARSARQRLPTRQRDEAVVVAIRWRLRRSSEACWAEPGTSAREVLGGTPASVIRPAESGAQPEHRCGDTGPSPRPRPRRWPETTVVPIPLGGSPSQPSCCDFERGAPERGASERAPLGCGCSECSSA